MINKLDLVPAEEQAERIAALVRGYGPVDRHFAISAIRGEGCRELTFAIMDHLDQHRHPEAADAQADRDE